MGDAEWRVLATSPRIMLNIPKRPHLPLDARGELVLVFWSFHNSPILVYQLPPVPRLRRARAHKGVTVRILSQAPAIVGQ